MNGGGWTGDGRGVSIDTSAFTLNLRYVKAASAEGERAGRHPPMNGQRARGAAAAAGRLLFCWRLAALAVAFVVVVVAAIQTHAAKRLIEAQKAPQLAWMQRLAREPLKEIMKRREQRMAAINLEELNADAQHEPRHFVFAHRLLTSFSSQHRFEHERNIKLRDRAPTIDFRLVASVARDCGQQLQNAGDSRRMNENGARRHKNRHDFDILDAAQPLARRRPTNIIAWP